MHELKIIQDIFPLIEKVAKENNLKAVNKVVLSVGKLRQVEPNFLRFAFTHVAEDTIAKDAELEIKLIPVTVICQDCKKRFEIQENFYVCPECNGVALEVLTGKEVVLENIDGEEGNIVWQ
jgi:hydrogenase nickel incorporation protein HypA/HybF